MFYNSEKNIVNISNSILKHYGVDTFHPSLKELDEKLSLSSKKDMRPSFRWLRKTHFKKICV